MIRGRTTLTLILLVTGCQSENWGPYSHPRVTGQVLAADTQEPLAGVNVIRGGLEREYNSGSPPKGGELMMRKVPVCTDEKGRFKLDSERVLSIYRGAGWSQLRLRFEKAGFLTLSTNFSLSLDTNSPSGEALLAIGQVFLQPAAK